jgi:hypothetical protein
LNLSEGQQVTFLGDVLSNKHRTKRLFGKEPFCFKRFQRSQADFIFEDSFYAPVERMWDV